MACIEARGLRKAFGTTVAVDGVDLRVEEGRILGLIGRTEPARHRAERDSGTDRVIRVNCGCWDAIHG